MPSPKYSGGLAGFWIESHDSGMAVSAGALVKLSVEIEEALGVALSGVRELCHYFVAINRDGGSKRIAQTRNEER
jgi:hypothetical protein